jgi:hypothetical protein
MLTMNPTLLVGPSDWDDRRLPQEEFAARTAAFWRDHPPAGAAIVYGDRVNHAELAYLTHFTPKLEAALALIPRTDAATLLVGGGPNMLQAAKPLTFIADLRPLRDVGSTVAQWARAQGGAPVLIGGAAMPYALHREIADALGGERADKTAALRLEEHPLIAAGSEENLEDGGVYTLRIGLSDARGHAIASAMVAVHERGNEVLWSSPEAAR